jgi:F-type H+-transporting ATPase subunit b
MVALLLLSGTGGGQVERIAATFGVNWPHFLAQVVSFGIVCGLLYRFAYRPVLAMLEERRQKIAESLATAERIKAELLRVETERERLIDEAEVQARALVEEARAAACRVQDEEIRKALAAAEQIIARAREDTVREQARMLAELKREVGRLVVQTTAAVSGRILTPADERRLAEETARALHG